MQKPVAVISTLFCCGMVGGSYGAALGVIYASLLFGSGAHPGGIPDLVSSLALAISLGIGCGFPAGFISGMLGGSLGGPVGCSVGGFIGTAATMLLFFGSGGLPFVLVFGTIPSIWGAAAGLVLGLHIRRGVRVLPWVGWLAEGIHSSPLGRWLGWRQRQVDY